MHGSTSFATFLSVALVLALAGMFSYGPSPAVAGESVGLPEIEAGDAGSLSDLLYKRRSVRRFGEGELSLKEVARLLFAAQGVTRRGGFRTVPSAGALYPLEIYLASGEVEDLEAGVYHYRPEKHELELVQNGDRRKEIAQAAVGQMWINKAQAVLVVCAVLERTTSKYGKRGRRYVHVEAGCAAQSVSLQAADLGLGTTVVGAFRDSRLANILGIQDKVTPLLLLPVGRLP